MSNGRGISVSFQELPNVAQNVEEKVARYQSCYKKIEDEVRTLSTVWEGDAQKAFETQVMGFQSDFESMKNLLMKYGEFLRMAGNNYGRTEGLIINDAAENLRFGN